MMIWSGDHWSIWAIALLGVAMVAFWALVVWAVYPIVGGASRHHEIQPHQDNGKDSLDSL